MCTVIHDIQCESKNVFSQPWCFLEFFRERMGISNYDFARPLCVHIYAKLLDLIQA